MDGERKVASKTCRNAAVAQEPHCWAGDSARTSTKDSSATGRVKPNEICCQCPEARLLADCSGGNSRLSYLLGCGGRSFFDHEDLRYKAALRDRTNSAAPLFLTLSLAVTLVNALMLGSLAIDTRAGRDSTALGIFFRFQVSDFDRLLGFFSLCHFIFPSYLFWVVSRCVVSVTPKGN